MYLHFGHSQCSYRYDPSVVDGERRHRDHVVPLAFRATPGKVEHGSDAKHKAHQSAGPSSNLQIQLPIFFKAREGSDLLVARTSFQQTLLVRYPRILSQILA